MVLEYYAILIKMCYLIPSTLKKNNKRNNVSCVVPMVLVKKIFHLE